MSVCGSTREHQAAVNVCGGTHDESTYAATLVYTSNSKTIGDLRTLALMT